MSVASAADQASRLMAGNYPQDGSRQQLADAAQFIADLLAAGSEAATKERVRQAVKVLNKHRSFEHTALIGQAWHSTRGCDAVIQKCLAQALVELGAFGEADALLDEAFIAANAKGSDADLGAEVPEYVGLRGRIRKQRFIQGGDRNLLRDATDAYLQQYQTSDSFYHGVNVLALRLLEERVGLDPRGGESIPDLARAMLSRAMADRRRASGNPWPLATAAEACLALEATDGDGNWCDQSELWLYRFLAHAETGPFEIESYYRQLREVWQGSASRTDSGADRLAGIIERYVMRTLRRWSVEPRRAQELARRPDQLEKNFSGEKTFGTADLRKMLALAANIGCVQSRGGIRVGTGFLVPGCVFGFSPPLVFVTNAHVVSTEVAGALRPEDAGVSFEMQSAANGRPEWHEIGDVLFSSLPGELGVVLDKPEKLDVTIVSLQSLPPGLQGLQCAETIPLPAPTTRAYVVGHPKAGAMQFSLSDSVLLDVCDHDRLMHYRTPTDPGSSGSPVFNSEWQVIALHHAGSQKAPRLHGDGEYQANEGITIRAIHRAAAG